MTRIPFDVPRCCSDRACAGGGRAAAARRRHRAAVDSRRSTSSRPTFAELQRGAAGRPASRRGRLTAQYLERIATYEDRLNAIITVNPQALEEADAMDRERAAGQVRGPLHGIPIALKDNIHTTDIRTTGGALAFRDLMPPYDATLTKNLRDGGAVIIAKTVLTELAHWTAGAPTPMVANYTGVGRLRLQPVRPAPRSARPRRSTAGRCCRPADRARAPARRRASGRRASAPTPAARSSARRTPTCWPASGRRSAASAVTA